MKWLDDLILGKDFAENIAAITIMAQGDASDELVSAVEILGVEAIEGVDDEETVVERCMIALKKRVKDTKSKKMLSEIKPIPCVSDRLELFTQINTLAKRLE